MTISLKSLWFNSIGWNSCKTSLEFLCPIASCSYMQLSLPHLSETSDGSTCQAAVDLDVNMTCVIPKVKDRTFTYNWLSFLTKLLQWVSIHQLKELEHSLECLFFPASRDHCDGAAAAALGHSCDL